MVDYSTVPGNPIRFSKYSLVAKLIKEAQLYLGDCEKLLNIGW